MEIAIYFTRTTEYTWQGDLTDLPAAVRKGVTKREDGETVLDDELLGERLTDEVLEKLIKSKTNLDIQDDQYEVSEIEQTE